MTSYDELTAGSKVIIAAAGTTGFAISTTQNGNNRAQTAVTKNDNGTQITGPGDAVEIFTLEAGTESNTVAFHATTTAGYIYAANGEGGKNGNWLRTKADKDANGSFAITLGTDGDEDVIVAEANDCGHMRYNSKNSLFACYASGQAPVSIYKLAGTGSGDPLIEAPVEYSIVVEEAENGTVTASASTAFAGDVITLTVTPANGYTLDVLTVTNVTTSEAVAVTNNKFTMPAADVTVSASFKKESGVSFTYTATTTITSGYSYTVENGAAKDGYYQDKNSSTGLDIVFKKADNSAFFTTLPNTITLTAKIGGGTAKDPLTNNVVAYLIDSEGNNISSTATVVTTKVTTTTGSDFTVTLPLVQEAYGIRISHKKESGYNVRLYGVSFSVE